MKTIHAIYENGVFRPTVPVELPDNSEVELSIVPHEPREQDESRSKPLVDLMKRLDELPDNSDLPTDFAAQHDHYLYGTPKRP